MFVEFVEISGKTYVFLRYRNKGIASSGDATIDDVLSESLSHDFFFSEALPDIVSDINARQSETA